MTFNKFTLKIKRKFKHIIGRILFHHPRVIKYKFLSNCKNIMGDPVYNQPTQLLGEGSIVFGENVKLGYSPSPYLYSGYGYIEARKSDSKIIIGNDVMINNNFNIIGEGEGIEIGAKTLIGSNVEISDSDFHELDPERRRGGMPKTVKVSIGKNVFIGSNVKILKGVTIGDNSVIANSSIVTKTIPANVIAGGYPCKVIKDLDVN